MEESLSEFEKQKRRLGDVLPIFYDEKSCIRAFPVEKFEELQASDAFENVQIMHFIRHGEGEHNLRALTTGFGCQCSYRTKSPLGPCPYKDNDLLDSQLTKKGKKEAKRLATYLANSEEIQIDYVLVSPLSRAIQTCLISLNSNVKVANIPIHCVENLREQFGNHIADQRRTKSWLADKYPQIVFTKDSFGGGLVSEEDSWFLKERETKAHMAKRVEEFFQYSAHVPAANIVVYTHSSWLMTMSGEWYSTGEMRSYAIAHRKRIMGRNEEFVRYSASPITKRWET